MVHKAKTWKAQHFNGLSCLKKDGKDMVVEANTKGDARAIFKKMYGERAVKKSKGRNTVTNRIRLPQGYRVKNAERCVISAA